MTTPMDDDQLLSLLAETLAEPPPPAEAVDAAYAAYGWRELDGQLARLVADEPVEVMGFGQATPTRVLVYAAEGATIEVAVGERSAVVTTDPVVGRIVVHGPTGTRRDGVATAALPGRREFNDLRGPVRFEIVAEGWQAFTPWITI